MYKSLQSDWLTRADRNEVGSKVFKNEFSNFPQSAISHTPSALNAGAKRSGATYHMAMPQCCYLVKGAKRPSHTTNMKVFFRWMKAAEKIRYMSMSTKLHVLRWL